MSLFLALDHGTAFASAAARGSVASVIAVCVFAVVYARLEGGWPLSLAAATLAYTLVTVPLARSALDTVALAALALACVVVGRRLIPRREIAAAAGPLPAWDLPLRAILGTALVVGVTAAAPALGPFASAALATFPIFATILAVFAHRTRGHAAASEVLRGLMHGIAGFTAFFLVVALVLGTLGIAATYALATATVLLVQGATLALVRR